MKLIALFLLIYGVGASASEFSCEEHDVCFQSKVQGKNHFSEPITYEQSKEQAIKLLIDVLNTLQLEVIKENEYRVLATKRSSFLKVVTHFEFSFKGDKVIHFRAYSDSPKLDWGDTSDILEKIKFRFYQNNM